MPSLAVSPTDVLLVVGLGAAGFVVVTLVCVGVLAMLQLVLPSTDAGAAELDRTDPPPDAEQRGDRARLDAEGDA